VHNTAIQIPVTTIETGAATVIVPRGPAAPRERNPASPVAIREIARKLFAQADPTVPASHLRATTRDIPHVYTREIHGGAEKRLFHAVMNGERLFLHGTALGVGASTFVADYARAFNFTCKMRGDPRRIAHLSLAHGTTTVRGFLEALCNAVQSPLTPSEARLSSPLSLGKRIIAQADRRRVCAFVIDHVHHASDGMRSAIGDLMMATDPTYSVPLEIDEDTPTRSRISIVLVDHEPPEKLFVRQPEVLTLLQGAYAALRPFNTAEEVAEALRQADVGLDDLDLADKEDLEITKLILNASGGLMSNMAGLLRLIDLYATMHGGYRPDLELVNGALAHHRRMVRLLKSRGGGEGDSYRTVSAAAPRRRRQGFPPQRGEEERGGAGRSNRGSSAGGKLSRAAKLRSKSEAREIAGAEGRDMRRKGFSNLPEIAPPAEDAGPRRGRGQP
jgi:hypothetical protein